WITPRWYTEGLLTGSAEPPLTALARTLRSMRGRFDAAAGDRLRRDRIRLRFRTGRRARGAGDRRTGSTDRGLRADRDAELAACHGAARGLTRRRRRLPEGPRPSRARMDRQRRQPR